MDFLQALRMQNIFNPSLPRDLNAPIYGNDLPSQGGITGNMPSAVAYNPPPTAPPPAMPGMDIPVSAGLPGATPIPPAPDYSNMVSAGLPSSGGQTPHPNDSDPDILGMFNKMYQPQHDAEDKYNAMIKQYPQDKGHGKLARIGAALAAGVVGMDNPIAGYQFGKGLLDEGRRGQLEDWKAQIGPMQQAANLERYGNTNERTAAYQAIGEQLKAEAQKHKENHDDQMASIAQQKANLYAIKANSPNYVWDTSGPEVMIMDKKTGVPQHTGFKTSNLSQSDKILFNEQARLNEIAAGGAQSRLTQASNWHQATVQDPHDATKTISFMVNDQGDTKPINYGGINNPSAGPTNMTSPEAPGAATVGGATPGQAPGLSPSGGPVMQPNAPSTAAPPAGGNPQIPQGTPILSPALGVKVTDAAKLKITQMKALRLKTQEALDELKTLLDDKGNLTPTGERTFGMTGALNFVPYTQGYAGQASVNRLKSQQVIGLIADMKAQSATGATGFGQLNRSELATLEDAATKLKNGMPEESALAELRRIKEKLDKVMQPSDDEGHSAIPKSNDDIDAMIKRLGG